MEKTLKKYFALFALPGVICFLLAFLIPMFMGVFLSFCEFRNLADVEWVGIKNYISAFTIDKNYTHALWFTVKFTVVTVISINVLSFSLALLLTKGLKGTNIFRTIFFMPNLIGGIVLGWIWQVIINGVLLNYGQTIVSDPKYGFWGLVILMNWQNVGYMMVIYIAAIQNIPTDMLEAAEIDGAGYFRTLFQIKIPAVMPSITICLFMTLTNGFKLFDQNLALTAGAPAKQTEMLALNIYNTFYGRIGFEGVGQAKAVMFTIMVAVIALLQLRLTRSKEIEH
ncbi:MAG: sugar ABC transporter permease [Spirochaetaceae bacterium]|nr:sugar ABC transporter permease [Spirochaetaceae bacterium]MBO5447208.1 sugar ABC transporter permease [bacterium]MBP3449788.1 sugar ABC transporter permease [Spirochaetaceae bacterium]MBP3561243.1 sugar ABC transporter permease [Treponema sp.]MBQ7904544.1 sugar ABC transporter permease [Spirochaetaceae bacterium]